MLLILSFSHAMQPQFIYMSSYNKYNIPFAFCPPSLIVSNVFSRSGCASNDERLSIALYTSGVTTFLRGVKFLKKMDYTETVKLPQVVIRIKVPEPTVMFN